MKIPQHATSLLAADPLVQVATSDAQGTPHIAAAKGISVLDDEHLAFEDWFCTQTIENLEMNPRIALSVLDRTAHKGYQFIGTAEKAVLTEMLNGYAPEVESKLGPIPQAKHRLKIRVEKILELSTGPHSDK
ncbi:MAG: hypothetical protein Kow0099_08520 [Candidatus Abyssubacteria bacterium]